MSSERGDIAAAAAAIRDLLASGELALGVKRGLDYTRDFGSEEQQDECVLLSCDFKLIDGEMRQGGLSGKTSLSERRRIAAALLKLVRRVHDDALALAEDDRG